MCKSRLHTYVKPMICVFKSTCTCVHKHEHAGMHLCVHVHSTHHMKHRFAKAWAHDRQLRRRSWLNVCACSRAKKYSERNRAQCKCNAAFISWESAPSLHLRRQGPKMMAMTVTGLSPAAVIRLGFPWNAMQLHRSLGQPWAG